MKTEYDLMSEEDANTEVGPNLLSLLTKYELKVMGETLEIPCSHCKFCCREHEGSEG